MQTILNQMLAKYPINSLDIEKNALKEVVQEVALCGLPRADFFKIAAFDGLDRFSEDLDFSLLALSVLENEIRAVKLNFNVEEKANSVDSNIKSAFLKGNTQAHILLFYKDTQNLNPSEIIKVKFEVDNNPPASATFENRYRLLSSTYQVKLYDMPSLFAGKLHAVICRAWKICVKGRALYASVFYLSHNAMVNMPHLKARLVDSGFMKEECDLTCNSLIEILNERFAVIDCEQTKPDVLSFIKDKNKPDFWGQDFLKDVTKNLNTTKD